MDKRTFSGGTAAAFLTVPLFLLPAEIIPRFGEWLRELSLSGAAGNILAWAIVLALSALPALGLLWRPRCRWDWLLPLAAAETFAGLYLLVNPSLVSNVPGIDGGKFIALAAVGSVSSTLLAWAVLRSLKHIEQSVSPGKTLERLLCFSAALFGWLAAWTTGAGALEKIRNVAETNTMPGVSLEWTNFSIVLLAAADLIPTLLGCGALILAGRLARIIEADPFGEETVPLAEKLRRDCRGIAGTSVLIYAGGNLFQLLFLPFLRRGDLSVSFPMFPVLLAAALDLLCRYFRRAKAVSDDNESII